MSMPRIGMRIVKSSCAVFLCFLIYMMRQQEGIVFYSCIAAVLCIQQDTRNTLAEARKRAEGTLIGGAVGLGVLLLERAFIPSSMPFVQYALISFMIIPIIYGTILLKRPSASYFSCVVFLSVTVVHGSDVMPYVFAMDRMIDTFIGIGVAFFINCLRFPFLYNKKALFVVTLEDLLEEGKLSPYTTIKLRQLLEQGANIMVKTSYTPASFLPLLPSIPLRLPVILFHGALLYDIEKQDYHRPRSIGKEVVQQLLSMFQEKNCNCFIYHVEHDVLHIHYGDFQNEAEKEYYETMRRSPYQNYVYGVLPQHCEPLLIRVIQWDEQVRELHAWLKKQPIYAGLQVEVTKNASFHGYSNMEIYSKEASNNTAIEEVLREHALEYTYVVDKPKEAVSLESTHVSRKRFVMHHSPILRRVAHLFHQSKKKTVGPR